MGFFSLESKISHINMIAETLSYESETIVLIVIGNQHGNEMYLDIKRPLVSFSYAYYIDWSVRKIINDR